MRVTQSMISRIGVEQLANQRNRLARTQEQAATGLRVNRPSDDPVDYRTGLRLKDSRSQTGRFLRAIDLSRTRLRTTEVGISDSIQVVSAARVQALAGLNTTNQGPAARAALKIDVEQLFDQMLSYANSRSPDGSYVFSGVASDTESFQAAGSFASGTPPTVSFTGDPSVIDIEIDEGVYIDVTADGSQVFQGSVDVFAVLGNLWSGLDANDTTQINAALGDLELAESQLLAQQTRIGGEERKADEFQERLRLQEQEFDAQISFLEDADAFEVYSDLVAQETSLQATLSVTSRLLTPSLLDFI